jgi:hypothetical protein
VQVALVDADIAAHLIAWGDAAIGQPIVVERMGADVDGEVTPLRPLAVLAGADADGQVGVTVLLGQLAPVVDVEVGPVAADVQLSALLATHLDVHQLDALVGEVEAQRGDACGDGDANIVGPDGRQGVTLDGVLGLAAARNEE